MKKNKKISFLLVVCMMLAIMPGAAFAETGATAGSHAIPAEQPGRAFPDMTGHWAAAAVSKWADLGIVKGDSKGFRPDDSITRAELAVILDNLMGYQAKSDGTFADVNSGAWYEDAVSKASAAGILQGDGAGHALPNAKVTREQAAVMLARAFGVDEGTGEKTTFKDVSSISGWAGTLVFGMERNGYIGGMGNGIFEPKSDITRAQVVTMIDNAVAAYYTKEGVYTENVLPKSEGANCVAIVKTSGVTLNNAVVSGDLIVAEGVGTGDFTLDGAIVSGKLIVRGGGENSIHVINGADVKGKVSVERVNGVIRIVSDGVVIDTLEAEAEVILEGEFTHVTVAEGAAVEVRGKIANLDVTGKAEIKAVKDSRIESITIEDGAKGTNLDIDKDAEISKLVAKEDMTTSGEGAPKSVAGTGSVTTKAETEANKDQDNGGGGTGGGNGGNGDNTPDHRSLSIEEPNKNETIPYQGAYKSGLSVRFNGTDKAGGDCAGLALGELTVKEGESLVNSSDYDLFQEDDSIKFSRDYLNGLSEGKHTLTYRIKTSDGKTFSTSSDIYIVPVSVVILYDQPESGTLKVTDASNNTPVSSGTSVTLTDYNYIKIELTGLPEGKRIRSATITNSYYGYTETKDITYDLVMDGQTIANPQGTATIRVVTEDSSAELRKISNVEFYLNYDYKTDTYLDRVTTEVSSMIPQDDSALYAKVLFENGETCRLANYKWVQECGTESIILEEGTENRVPLYMEFDDAESVMKLTVTGYENQSEGTLTASITIRKPLENQEAPTGLTGIAVSSQTAKDGAITGTTADMEYKLSTSADSAYVSCTAGKTKGLALGTYYVRLKAKPGYAAGWRTEVDVWMNQSPPSGLTGISPTGLYNGDAKITGTTADMEYKRSIWADYSDCTAGETEVQLAGTYQVRYPAVQGKYYASTDTVVTIDPFTKKEQAAPTGLIPIQPARATGNDGKISGTTALMEYRAEADSEYKSCSAGETSGLAAGIYYVRFKEDTGYHAGADAEVIITAPPAKDIATLQSLSYIYYDQGKQYQTSVPGFSPSKTDYDINLYGNDYGKTFDLNPYETDAPFADATHSEKTGEYTVTLQSEVTAEDGVTKLVYTVTITVERRIGTATINKNIYKISGDTEPVITMILSDRNGESCKLKDLIGSSGNLFIMGQYIDPEDPDASIIDPKYYTVDAENNKITVKTDYFSGKDIGSYWYFNIRIQTEDGYTIPVQELSAPHVIIKD